MSMIGISGWRARLPLKRSSFRHRKCLDTLLKDLERAARQALDIAVRHRVDFDDGLELRLMAQTLCIHPACVHGSGGERATQSSRSSDSRNVVGRRRGAILNGMIA